MLWRPKTNKKQFHVLGGAVLNDLAVQVFIEGDEEEDYAVFGCIGDLKVSRNYILSDNGGL